jgi:hypothetical protein
MPRGRLITLALLSTIFAGIVGILAAARNDND